MQLNHYHQAGKLTIEQKNAYRQYAKKHGYYYNTVRYMTSLRILAMAEYMETKKHVD